MNNIKAFRRRRNIWGWALSIPAVVSICLFIVYPTVFSVILSFTDLRYTAFNLHFQGFENYKYVFTNPNTQFWPALLTSLEFAVISTILQTILAFLNAYLLYKLTRKLQTIYRVLVYLPGVLPVPVVSVMWRFVFAHDYGLIDKVLLGMGFTDLPAWLVTPGWAMASIILVNTWWYIGGAIILYFVSMNAVPRDCLESAKIDGINTRQELWHFILPLTFSMTKVNLVLSLVGGMHSFSLFYLFTQGLGDTRVVGLIIFETMYSYHNMSLSVTMGIILCLILAVFIWFGNFFLAKRGNVYE